jgi:hypothetical protein
MISRRLVSLAALLLVAGGISFMRAQDSSTTNSTSQSDSLGDAARKARAQKKDSTKPAKVFTNEDLGSLKGTISVIGNQPTAAADADKTAEKTDDKKPANGPDGKGANGADAKDAKKDGPKDESYWRAKFGAARKTLADDSKELDILQREFNLKQEQFYQDPNAALMQQYSRSDLDKAQSEIEAKKQAVEKDKQALSDLEDELRKSGGDPGWANEPSGSSDSRGSKSDTSAS